MELCAGDNIVANPTAADVTATIDANAHDDECVLRIAVYSSSILK